MAEALMTYGVPGPQGVQGPQGATGACGPAGPSGPAGSVTITFKSWTLEKDTRSVSLGITPKLIFVSPIMSPDFGSINIFMGPGRGCEIGYGGNGGNRTSVSWSGGSTLTISPGLQYALTLNAALIS